MCPVANSDPDTYDTETAEYKFYIPNKITLARDIAAFANSQGCKIYIGYIPTIEGLINLTGLTDAQVYEALETVNKAVEFLRPHPLIDIVQDDTLENKPFVVVTVQKYPAPVLFNDRYYVREGSKTTLAEEKLLASLSEAVPSIQHNILESLQAEETSDEKNQDNASHATNDKQAIINRETLQGQIIGATNTITIIHEKLEENPQRDINELLKDSIQRTRDDLTAQRKERLQQARITFVAAIVVLILAILLVFVGVVLIFINKTQEGVVSSVASIVSGIVSGLALALNKQTNDRLDEYARELVALEKSYTGMQFISLISDVRMKDEAIRDLAKSISMGNQAN